ncbi:unnamed protein product (plasmid) [Mycetohabitans rhizoxinica HKI 454]|uniref:Uncharacterized protein n=1 Tax=Mycetohabitans rhizoxinica (strain DSM 19002 / CIP 109453 / HKI 454) TaxID=882378 RepID=E5AUJ1_MYCRK|nr:MULTISPECIES: hypothetical protein [Mycetohabitans]CBW76765.1 unnamed protein product [Mycetohabitans rhizoxinica HKI 454]
MAPFLQMPAGFLRAGASRRMGLAFGRQRLGQVRMVDSYSRALAQVLPEGEVSGVRRRAWLTRAACLGASLRLGEGGLEVALAYDILDEMVRVLPRLPRVGMTPVQIRDLADSFMLLANVVEIGW